MIKLVKFVCLLVQGKISRQKGNVRLGPSQKGNCNVINSIVTWMLMFCAEVMAEFSNAGKTLGTRQAWNSAFDHLLF